MKPATPNLADYALLTLLASIWGSSFMLIKVAVETIPAVPMTAIRLIIAAIVMLIVMYSSRQRLPSGINTWIKISLVAVFGNALPFALISWGEESVDSGLAAIMMAVMPLTTLFLAHIFTDDEKLNRWKFAGVMLGVVGLVVLIGPTKLLTLGQDVIHQLAIAFAAVCYAVSTLVVKSIRDVPGKAMTAGILLVSVTVIVPASLFLSDLSAIMPSTTSVSAVVVLGVVHTAIANLLAFFIIRKLGATYFSQLNFFVPLFGVFFGFVFLSEIPSIYAIVALIIILVGVGLARYGIKQAAFEQEKS